MFIVTPGKVFTKEKITSGIIDGYKCEIIRYAIQRHGESSTTYVSFVTYFPESLNMGVKIIRRGSLKEDEDHVAITFHREEMKDLVRSQRKNLED